MNTLDHPDGVTFVHVVSESSDHYYFARGGLLTDEEIEQIIPEEIDWEDPDLLYLEGVLQVPR